MSLMQALIFVAALWLVGMLPTVASAETQTSCNSGPVLPFANISRTTGAGDIIINTDGLPACLSDGTSIPNSYIPLALLERSGTRYIIARRAPIGHFALLAEVKGKGFKPLNLAYDERNSFNIQHAFVANGRIFLLVYDASVNIPSGRRFSRPSEGNDLYEIRIDGDRALLEKLTTAPMPSGLDIAGLDAQIAGGHLVCSQTSCSLIAGSDNAIEVRELQTPLNEKGILVELASDGRVAWGLFQVQFDDRLSKAPSPDDPVFSVCRIAAQPDCENVPATIIPYKLRVQDGRPAYQAVHTVDDLVDLLSFDLRRLRGSGVAGYSQNNMEGQIAWSSVYYVNGLITLGRNQSGLPGAFEKLRQDATERARLEARRIASLNDQPYPWYLSKRYSLNREPIASVVHLGRIARVLKRARELTQDSGTDRTLEALEAELVSPTISVERIFDSTEKGRTEIRFLRNSPFWADGVNVAWNYQSAWIEALAMLGALDKNPNLMMTVSRMVDTFLREENISSRPIFWRYSSGDFFQGWTVEDDVSTNTPAYPGDHVNTTAAHISYRTMDAMALLAASRARVPGIPAGLASYFRELVEKGFLYPLVAEELALVGETPQIPLHVARHYARSVLPHQLQNQPWALAAIARSLRRP
ncbi:hypothetical protein QNA08_16315 [Chelatococcus sp. SYSU_G07232]|uniref:Glycogen debranching enzyme C-terminal domain-containing protein n=1 Tax=Chelatococcus albus TaxID=3047466 RepID=A0ABT7AKA8_9HYPH|nr:hypothetical protein [Chelatococcus sp. SYSU_G07232]MDJ1159788.1 hypothetical protein [Chelatococcus sp. SYSU_G07232]